MQANSLLLNSVTAIFRGVGTAAPAAPPGRAVDWPPPQSYIKPSRLFFMAFIIVESMMRAIWFVLKLDATASIYSATKAAAPPSQSVSREKSRDFDHSDSPVFAKLAKSSSQAPWCARSTRLLTDLAMGAKQSFGRLWLKSKALPKFVSRSHSGEKYGLGKGFAAS